MIKFTGHELDGVVVLTVDSEELVQRLLPRAETDGRPTTPRRSSAAARRCTPSRPSHSSRSTATATSSSRSTAWVTSTRSPADLRALCRTSTRARPVGFRDRGVEIKTPTRSPRCGSPGSSSARPWSCCVPRYASASPPASSTPSPRRTSVPAAAPLLPRLRPPAVPRNHLRLRQRRGGARHPGREGAGGRRRHLHRLRCDRRRLARRRGDHRRRSGRCRPRCPS